MTTDASVEGATTWALAAVLARSLKISIPEPHEVDVPEPVVRPLVDADEWGWEPEHSVSIA